MIEKKAIGHKILYVIVTCVFSLFVGACNSNEDLLKDVRFGQDSLCVISKIDGLSYEGGINGGLHYEIPINNKKYSLWAYGICNNGIISKVDILLQQDSGYINGTKVDWSHSPIPSSEMDEIWDLYCKWYGEPDSLWMRADTIRLGSFARRNEGFIIPPPTRSSYFDKPSSDGLFPVGYDILKKYGKYPKIDTVIVDETNIARIAIWNTKFYQLILHQPMKCRYLYDTTQLYCDRATITYLMHNYEKIKEQIEDSVRNSYQIDDLVFLCAELQDWTDYGWLGYVTIRRPSNLDRRHLISVRYEIIMKDAYDEILYRSEPLTLDIVNDARSTVAPLRAGDMYIRGYVSFLAYDSELLKVATYAKSNEVRAILRPLAIIFKTGEVLRRND